MRGSPLAHTAAEIASAAGLAGAFWQSEHFHLRLPNPPWMDLVIESWPVSHSQRHISVAHYYEQNGDLVPDPEVEMTEYGDPVSLSQALGYTEVRDAHTRSDVLLFLDMWARNIREQGFIDAARRYSATHRLTVTSHHGPQV